MPPQPSALSPSASTSPSPAATPSTPSSPDGAGSGSASSPPPSTDVKRAKLARKCGQEERPKKKKIRTYCRRKEEKEKLLVELAQLEERLDVHAKCTEVAQRRKALLRCESQNKSLREAIHSQRLLLANTTSIIAQFMREQDYNPFDTFIRLGKDAAERHAALLAIKPLKIQGALQFLTEHRRFMDPTAEFCESKQFKARTGDICSMKFEIVPFPNASSVKAVFDTLQTFVHNMEISVSEVLGDITVRENDDDNFDDSVTQHRFVTSISDMVFLDTNNVTFAQYEPQMRPGTSGTELGVMIAEYVDEDELFPYRPNERVRQDVTTLNMVESYPRNPSDPRDRIVVVTRWSFFRFHRSDLISIPRDLADRILSGVSLVDNAMMTAVRQSR